MKAKELRIGNLVFNKERNCVDTINGIFIEYGLTDDECVLIQGDNLLDYGIDHIQPIQLTEEWLVKFGFEYDDEEHIYYKPMFDYGGDQCEDFKLSLISNDEHYLAVDNKETYEAIEHVHKLQNLYFALTGEELEIKNL